MLTSVQEKMFASCSQYAFVGASSNPAKFGNKLFEKYKASGLKAIPVNPNEKSIDGIECLKSIEELPSPSTTGLIIVTKPPVTLSILKMVLSMGTIPIVFVQPGAADEAVADFVDSNGMGDKVHLEDIFKSSTVTQTSTPKGQKPDLSPIDTKVSTNIVLNTNINTFKTAVGVDNRRTLSTPLSSKGTTPTPRLSTPTTAMPDVSSASTPLSALRLGTPLVSSPITRASPASKSKEPKQQQTPLTPTSTTPSSPWAAGTSSTVMVKPNVLIPCGAMIMLKKITDSMATTAGNVTNALTSPVAENSSVLQHLSHGVASGMRSLSLHSA